MSFLDTLDRLRAKPLHVRKQISIALSGFFSLIILSVWWGGWSNELARTNDTGEKIEKSPTEAVAGMFSELKSMTKESVSDAMGQIQYAAEHPELVAAVASSTYATSSIVDFNTLLRSSE